MYPQDELEDRISHLHGDIAQIDDILEEAALDQIHLLDQMYEHLKQTNVALSKSIRILGLPGVTTEVIAESVGGLFRSLHTENAKLADELYKLKEKLL